MKLTLIILCFLIAGCACPQVQDEHRKRIEVYDTQGNVKEHVIIQDGNITIYDKDWKTKGYGKIAD